MKKQLPTVCVAVMVSIYNDTNVSVGQYTQVQCMWFLNRLTPRQTYIHTVASKNQLLTIGVAVLVSMYNDTTVGVCIYVQTELSRTDSKTEFCGVSGWCRSYDT